MAEKSGKRVKKQKTNNGNVRSYKIMTFSEDEESLTSQRNLKQEMENVYHTVNETDAALDEVVDAQDKAMHEERCDAELYGDDVSVSENGSYAASDLSHGHSKIGKRKSKKSKRAQSDKQVVIDNAAEREICYADGEKVEDSITQSSPVQMTKPALGEENQNKKGKKKKNQKSSSLAEPEDMNDRIEKKHDSDFETKQKSTTSKNIKLPSDRSECKELDSRKTEEAEDEISPETDVDKDDKDHDNSSKNQTDGPVPLEKQVKFCQDRTTHVEKNYGAFCETLSSITRKIARMRDKGDLLSKQVVEYTDKEKISLSTKKNLTDFAHNLAAIQDYRDAEIHRLENKVIKPLTAYGPKCKKMKQVIKSEQSAINREVKQRKNLEKVRDKKPGDAHSIAETELQKASADAAIGSQGLQNQMKVFEKEKLTDLKRILADFVSVEMVFHAKAIEYYSQCFENLAMIDEEYDLDEFSRKLNIQQADKADTLQLPPGMAVPQGTITSLGSTLRSNEGTSEYTSGEYTTGEYTTGSSYTYTYGDSTTSSAEKRVRIQTVGQSMYADVDEDDDDDDEDDEDPQLYSRPMRRQ